MNNIQKLLAKKVRQEIIKRRKTAIAAIDQAVKSNVLVQV
jgi:hypothetical protein